MKTIVHVNQFEIRRNAKDGGNRPPLTVRTYKDVMRCHEVEFAGKSRIVHRPDKPLSCGARVWIETQGKVKVLR